MKKKKSILLWGALAACAGGVLCFRRSIRMPLKEYTRYALFMAVLDDEICRNELQGRRFGGRTVLFPPKSESLQYRYHLFLQMNRKKSRARLQMETDQLEQRLNESRAYRDDDAGDCEFRSEDILWSAN